jgi:hypothetical protein
MLVRLPALTAVMSKRERWRLLHFKKTIRQHLNCWRGRYVMSESMQQRIDSMYARDRLWALVFIVALWVGVGAVYLGVRDLVENDGVSLALLISGFLIVGYNTASLLAMISHYGHDKDWIYGTDIKHLDIGR